MYKVLIIKKGEKIYRCQPEKEIDCFRSFHNPTLKNQNWNDSLYFFREKGPAIDGYGERYDNQGRFLGYNYLIECILRQDLKIVHSDDEYFATGKLPYIGIIVENTEQAIKKEYPKDKERHDLQYHNQGADYNFMTKLGNKGFAFSCYENLDKDKEVIIPELLLRLPDCLFSQKFHCYPFNI